VGLPIRTTLDDIQAICNFLSTKPTGTTIQEAKAVLDSSRLDARKIAALKFWGLIEDQERLKINVGGRSIAKNTEQERMAVLLNIIRTVNPYRAIIERAAHRQEESLTATDVAAHWHDHFGNEVGDSDRILNDQAVCFFHIAQGAGLGTLITGRKGSPTRLDFDKSAIAAFIEEGESPVSEMANEPELETKDKSQFPQDVTSTNGSKQEKDADSENIGQGIFIAHGKNKKPLEQLKRILDQFKIQYKVAVDEPNPGRPISSKIREIMRACNCAILIFTADEEFKDKDGKVIWRPSENVVYELGATGYLYDNRIVIMKEDSVDFPSNFRDIGYISFANDQLEAKAMEILRELIGFGIVKVST